MEMRFKDYYQILNVSQDASAQDIKKAFRRLALQHHPTVIRKMSGKLVKNSRTSTRPMKCLVMSRKDGSMTD